METKEQISNEVKAKVFAQCLGQTMLVNWPEHPIASEEKLLGIELSGAVHTPEMQFGMDKKDVLILRPLSAITDEDKIGAVRACYKDHVFDDEATKGIYSVHMNEHGTAPVQFYQYLQSKGYDLPHYLLGGKTLKEAGLAIYEHENL